MGKVKSNKKNKNARVNATGILTDAQLEAENGLVAVPVETILPVIQKLSSPDADERAWAAAGASNLLMHDAATRRLMLSKGLIPALVDRLTDSVHEVVVEALGALRNLTVVGSVEVIGEMFNKNLLTPLCALIPPLGTMIEEMLIKPEAENADEHKKRKTVWDCAENIISILWAMSENSPKAFLAINKLNLVPFLMSFVQPGNIGKLPPTVVVAACQCLYTLTDENPACTVLFTRNPENIQPFIQILAANVSAEQDMLIKTLACGIIINLRTVVTQKATEKDYSEIHNMVLPVLSSSLNYDLQKAASEAAVAAVAVNARDTGVDLAKPNQPATTEEIALAAIETRLQTLQLSLELIANICTESVEGVDHENEDGLWHNENAQQGDDDDDLDMDADEDEEEEEPLDNNQDDDENTLREMEQLAAAAAETPLDLSSHPIINILVNTVFPALIHLATPTELSFPAQQLPTPKSTAPVVTAQLATTHLRALEALNNFLLTMTDSVPGKWWFHARKSDAEQCWTWLFQQAATVNGSGVNVGAEEKGQEMRGSILEAIVGCLWTLARGLDGAMALDQSQVEGLIATYNCATVDSVRVKLIGCLGVLGKRQGAVENNRRIGGFLMALLKNNPSTETCVEALNAMYDIYADGEFDYDKPVYIEGKFNNDLKAMIKKVKDMARHVDRRNKDTKDLRDRADEAAANLKAFVSYKAKEANERQ